VDGVCCDGACDGGCRRCDVPGRVGTCSLPCAGADVAVACPGGGSTCANEACVAVPCAPYRCDADQGVCLDRCESVEDCAAGQACDLDGRCVSPPDVSASDDACSASSAAPHAGAPWPLAAWALAGLGAVLARRRRRPR
jgi:MYXO-CTERM domain-containing protein